MEYSLAAGGATVEVEVDGGGDGRQAHHQSAAVEDSHHGIAYAKHRRTQVSDFGFNVEFRWEFSGERERWATKNTLCYGCVVL